VYYISEVLHEAKTRYLEVHNLLYTVLISSRMLHHYFQAHKISVVFLYPLRVVLHNPNTTGNIAKWVVELAEFELDFVSHYTIKSHVLADFIVEWMLPASHPGGPDDSEPEAELRSLSDPTGLSSLMPPHISRGRVRRYCSMLHLGTNLSIWCT
jgi:hypothetical protein